MRDEKLHAIPFPDLPDDVLRSRLESLIRDEMQSVRKWQGPGRFRTAYPGIFYEEAAAASERERAVAVSTSECDGTGAASDVQEVPAEQMQVLVEAEPEDTHVPLPSPENKQPVQPVPQTQPEAEQTAKQATRRVKKNIRVRTKSGDIKIITKIVDMPIDAFNAMHVKRAEHTPAQPAITQPSPEAPQEATPDAAVHRQPRAERRARVKSRAPTDLSLEQLQERFKPPEPESPQLPLLDPDHYQELLQSYYAPDAIVPPAPIERTPRTRTGRARRTARDPDAQVPSHEVLEMEDAPPRTRRTRRPI
jgi:hypothetical protein